MTESVKSLSEWQLALQRFGRRPEAVVCVLILALLILGAVFADFLAPYSAQNESRNFSYCPPTLVHFTENGRMSAPFVYGIQLTYDRYHKRVYIEDKTRKFPLRFFVKGDAYKWLGLIPSRLHFWGVKDPGRIYLLGADSRGRDLFSRILHGSRISLSIGLIGIAISFAIGLVVGGIAGYYGGWIDNLLMRLCEIFMMAPGFYLMLALRAVVPPNFNSLQTYFAIVVILSFIGWASLARIIRGMCLSLREREYVLAARSLGVSDLKIIMTHLLPHTLSYTIAVIVISVPGYILGESALSLIGLGIQDPFASWGNLLSDAMSIVRIKFYPWILWPGFFIFLTVLCFNLVGDALRDSLDPLLKAEMRRK